MNSRTLHMWFWCFVLVLECSCSNIAAITVSEPKIYMQEDVVRTLAEYREKTKASAGSLPVSTLQEMLDAQQITRTDIQNSVSPAGESLVSAPSPVNAADIQFRAPIGVIKDLSLPARAQLRNLVVNQQLIMGYDLLYKGDARFLDEDIQVVLVRFDVSINKYMSSLWTRRFAIVLFSVDALCDNLAPCPERPQVYALFPEFTAVTAQESLLTSSLRSLASQAGSTSQGVDAKTARRDQSGIQEQFTALTEHPMQFAIYEPLNGVKGSHFAFAFGPRRRIEKRALYNPGRWFGDTYTVDYEIEPGPRDLYALLLVPRLAKQVKVSTIAVPYLASESNLSEIFETLANVFPKDSGETVPRACKIPPKEDKSGSDQGFAHNDGSEECKPAERTDQVTSIAVTGKAASTPEVEGAEYLIQARNSVTNILAPYMLGKSSLLPTTSVWTKRVVSVKPRGLNTTHPDFECYVVPSEILVGMTSSILITCNRPLTPDTDVWLGPISIPRDQVTLINRYQLRVGIASAKGLEAIVKTGIKIRWTIVNGGKVAIAPPLAPQVGDLDASILTAQPEALFSLKPSSAQPSTLAELTLATMTASQVLEVWIGNDKAQIPIPPVDPMSKTISFTLPNPAAQLPTAPLPVVLVIRKTPPGGGAPQTQHIIIDKVFTYVKP